jgi:probable phosphoglycerate mutase
VATILLVRHATTATTGKRLGGWTPGVHLDDRGIAQAEATAERLADLPIAAVYASPLERTQDTAKIIARRLGLRVRTRKGLGEVDYGDWTDQALGNLRRRKLWQVVQRTPSRMVFPGGESIRGMQARIVEQIEALADAHGADTIVAVSHADVIKAAVAHFLGTPLDLFQRIVIAPASVTVLTLPEGGGPVVSGVNVTGIPSVPSREGKR